MLSGCPIYFTIFPHMIEQSKVNDKLPDMTLYEMSIDVSVLYKNPINVLF
jgi:hypothetical protein